MEAFFVVVKIARVNKNSGALHHFYHEIFIRTVKVLDSGEKVKSAPGLVEGYILAFTQSCDGGVATFFYARAVSFEKIFAFAENEREHCLAYLVGCQERIHGKFELF